jgi:hypothetical protein
LYGREPFFFFFLFHCCYSPIVVAVGVDGAENEKDALIVVKASKRTNKLSYSLTSHNDKNNIGCFSCRTPFSLNQDMISI